MKLWFYFKSSSIPIITKRNNIIIYENTCSLISANVYEADNNVYNNQVLQLPVFINFKYCCPPIIDLNFPRSFLILKLAEVLHAVFKFV